MLHLLLLLALTLPPAPTAYIDDDAHLLSASTTASLEAEAVDLHNKTQAQVFLVTVPSLAGADLKSYATNLFHTWHIGQAGTDRGALILFSLAEHQYRIEVGYGLEPILNDAKAGDIGRSMVPNLRAADYDAAATLSFARIAELIAADSHVTLATPKPLAAPPAPDPPPGNADSHLLVLILMALSFLFFILWIAIRRTRTRTRTGTRVRSNPASPADSAFLSSSGSSFTDSSHTDTPAADTSSATFSGGDGGDSGGGGADGGW